MLGLRRLKLDAIWLEILPATNSPRADEDSVCAFQRGLRKHGLTGRYCLLHQKPACDRHELGEMRCFGISRRDLLDRLRGPNTLLNLSYSIHPPFLLQFDRRIFCDLDPSEIFYWMTKMEMGQSYHHEFTTVGLNVGSADCKLPPSPLRWKTFFPLVDTKSVHRRRRPSVTKFTTIGQWYWGGGVEVQGRFPDLSKKFAFEQYLDLPKRVPEAVFELAMNLNADDPEIARLRRRGWRVVAPHRVARTPTLYRRYISASLGEFTAIKGVDVSWRTGWLSDRAAMFLALGRPVITENTGAAKFLPPESGFYFVNGLAEAEVAVREVLEDWKRVANQARECAVSTFDSAANLRKILEI